MEDGFGVMLPHFVTFQWDVFDSAALSEQQVCPGGERDLGSRPGSNGCGFNVVVDTWYRLKKWNGAIRSWNFSRVCVPLSFTHTSVGCREESGSRRSPARFGPRTSSTRCWSGTGWARNHRSRHTLGCTDRQGVGGPAADRTQLRREDCPCGSRIESLSCLKEE